jgi:hypothetical protein
VERPSSYNTSAMSNGSGHCRNATMQRDSVAGLIEPMLNGAAGCSLAPIRETGR